MSAEPVSVRILDREYTVGVGGDERDSLMAAARLLDARMREIRGSNRMAAVDRIAVLAALNLAHELQLLRDENARQAVALQQTLARGRIIDRLLAADPKNAGYRVDACSVELHLSIIERLSGHPDEAYAHALRARAINDALRALDPANRVWRTVKDDLDRNMDAVVKAKEKSARHDHQPAT